MVDPSHSQDTPLEHPGLIRSVGGSYAKNVEGKYQAGYTVTTSYELLESFPNWSLLNQNDMLLLRLVSYPKGNQ